MTVKADNKKRVVLPTAKPGDCFEVQVFDNELRLTLMKPVVKPDKVRLVRSPAGYFVAVGTKPITQRQVRGFIDEFP
jgi:hypothetical protein